MMALTSRSLVMGAALACGAAADAQNVTADPASMAEALRNAGYRAEIVPEPGSAP
jgi:hypothetical protein